MVLQDRCPADLFAALLAFTRSVIVATLTRTHPVATGRVFNRRQHRSSTKPPRHVRRLRTHRGGSDLDWYARFLPSLSLKSRTVVLSWTLPMSRMSPVALAEVLGSQAGHGQECGETRSAAVIRSISLVVSREIDRSSDTRRGPWTQLPAGRSGRRQSALLSTAWHPPPGSARSDTTGPLPSVTKRDQRLSALCRSSLPRAMRFGSIVSGRA